MNTLRHPSSPARRTSRTAVAIAAALAVQAALVGQNQVAATPYGEPSESLPGGAAAVGLYLGDQDGTPSLRLEGGRPGAPALIVFAAERNTTELPTGGTLLVGRPIATATGAFDAQGVFVLPLSGATLSGATFDAAGDALFAQGIAPSTDGSHGAELSGGLQLQRTPAPAAPTHELPEPPDDIVVAEFADMLRAGYFEAALDLALNSKDDALTLEIAGNLEVPVWPGITAGGKAGFKAAVKRGEDSRGATVYDLAIGADVAASAGVGAGVAGAGASAGLGGELVWRFASAHEAARAVRSIAVLQAIGPRLEATCTTFDSKVAQIDRAIHGARTAIDGLRNAVRSVLPWRDNARVRELQRHQDQLRAERRALVDRGQRALDRLTGWVANARWFLNEHLHGSELRATNAVDCNVGTGFGDANTSGRWQFANLGASIAASAEHQFAVRVERLPESAALQVEHRVTFTRSVAAAAGFVGGGALNGKRVLELSHRMRIDGNGAVLGEDATTVKLAFDGRLAAVVGAVVTGQAAIGGQLTVEVPLQDLLGACGDALAVLFGDDEQSIVGLLRALPVAITVCGRYEAGVAIGFGVDLDGVAKFGLGGAAMLIDCGPARALRVGADGDAVTSALRQGPLAAGDHVLTARLDAVRCEVAGAMQR